MLKSDFNNGGDPPIWKIDGKALLQKYIPFEQEGKTLYRNTSVVSIVNGDTVEEVICIQLLRCFFVCFCSVTSIPAGPLIIRNCIIR